MRSSNFLNATIGEPTVFGKFTPLGNLNISNTFWPPFIDAKIHNQSITLSGPLSAVIMEFANFVKFRSG